ncbi:hypothetical protein PYCC9005_005586 [Savitreella phatthalungensis]
MTSPYGFQDSRWRGTPRGADDIAAPAGWSALGGASRTLPPFARAQEVQPSSATMQPPGVGAYQPPSYPVPAPMNAPYGLGFDAPVKPEFGHSRYASTSSAYDLPFSRSLDSTAYASGGQFSPPMSPAQKVTLKAKRKRASPQQLGLLNDIFEKTFFPSTELRNALGKELAMTSRTVQIWFQNRRQAWRTQRGKDAHMAETISNDNERSAWEVLRDYQSKRANGDLGSGPTAEADLTIMTDARRGSVASDRTLRTDSTYSRSTPRQTPRSATYEHAPLSADSYNMRAALPSGFSSMPPPMLSPAAAQPQGEMGFLQQSPRQQHATGTGVPPGSSGGLSASGMLPPLHAYGDQQGSMQPPPMMHQQQQHQYSQHQPPVQPPIAGPVYDRRPGYGPAFGRTNSYQ